MPPGCVRSAGTVPATRTKLRGGSYPALMVGLQALTKAGLATGDWRLAAGGWRLVPVPLRFYTKQCIVL